MEDLLIIILQCAFEIVFQIIANIPFDWPSSEIFGKDAVDSSAMFILCVFMFFTGCGVAGISLLILKRTFIPTAAMRIANLFTSPVAAAYLTEFLAARSSKANARNHFWPAFWFTAAFVGCRFAYIVR